MGIPKFEPGKFWMLMFGSVSPGVIPEHIEWDRTLNTPLHL